MAVKVGFNGTGSIARSHLAALGKIENAEVVACTDLDEERAAEAAARFPGAGAYTDIEQMLEAQQLDTVFICLPPHAHGEPEMALIRRGIPFFVEKPVSNDLKTPLKILEAVKGKDLMTSVGYLLRYRGTVERVRQHLAGDAPVLARAGWICRMPQVRWWRQKALSGGQIIEQTTHGFDLARYLFGEAETVFCAGRKGLITDVEGYDIEDASVCVVKFESGMVCEMSSSCAVEAGGDMLMEVFCRNARLKFSGWDWNLEIEKQHERCEISSAEDVFEIEDRVWIDAVESGDAAAVKSTYEDACKTQMLTCAAERSLASGQPQKP